MDSQAKLPASFLFEGQLQHIMLLACLAPGAMYLAAPALDGSAWLGVSDYYWFYAVLIVAVVHQVVGWFVFRTQLVFALFSRLFGKYDMMVWESIFFPLLLLRPILMIALGLADAGSLGSFRSIQIVLGLILLLPALYTGWLTLTIFPKMRWGEQYPTASMIPTTIGGVSTSECRQIHPCLRSITLLIGVRPSCLSAFQMPVAC
jgi:hypothetical protein